MRIPLILTLIACASLANPAAAVKLSNRDSTPYDLLIKCSSISHSSIGALSTRDLGSGPCIVTIKKSGSAASASGSENLVIRDGTIRTE